MRRTIETLAWILAITSVLSGFALMLVACALAVHQTDIHARSARAASWTVTLPARADRQSPIVDASDLQCFSVRDGSALRQIGHVWYSPRGYAVARYARHTRTFVNLTTYSVLCGAWKDGPHALG